MEALLKFDVASPRALASHGGRVTFRGGGCLNYVPLPIPTIPALPVRLVHHHVLPLFLDPGPPKGSLAPTVVDSLGLSPALSLSLSSPSLFFLFPPLFFHVVFYRRSLHLTPHPGVAKLLVLLLLLELLQLELLQLMEGLAEGAPPVVASNNGESEIFNFLIFMLICTG